jgi:hypothetical protein
MIWVSIYYVVHARMSTLQPMIHFEISLSYRIRECNSCTKRGFLPFPPSHTKTSGYCHHYRQFWNHGECFHYWSNLYRFGVACFDDNNTCNNNYCLRQSRILHRTNTKKWFHSPCHKDLWLSPFSFWFLVHFFFTCLYSSSLVNILGTFDAYISL